MRIEKLSSIVGWPRMASSVRWYRNQSFLASGSRQKYQQERLPPLLLTQNNVCRYFFLQFSCHETILIVAVVLLICFHERHTTSQVSVVIKYHFFLKGWPLEIMYKLKTFLYPNPAWLASFSHTELSLLSSSWVRSCLYKTFAAHPTNKNCNAIIQTK